MEENNEFEIGHQQYLNYLHKLYYENNNNIKKYAKVIIDLDDIIIKNVNENKQKLIDAKNKIIEDKEIKIKNEKILLRRQKQKEYRDTHKEYFKMKRSEFKARNNNYDTEYYKEHQNKYKEYYTKKNAFKHLKKKLDEQTKHNIIVDIS